MWTEGDPVAAGAKLSDLFVPFCIVTANTTPVPMPVPVPAPHEATFMFGLHNQCLSDCVVMVM